MDKSNQRLVVQQTAASQRRPARIHAAHRTERGAQLIELALVTPLMLVLLAATVEFGLYYHTYMTLDKATRLGARYLSSREFTVHNQLRTIHLVVCGSDSLDACAPGTEIISGLSDANVNLNYTPADGDHTIPDRIEVGINGFQYQPFFDLGKFVGGASWQSVPVTPSTTMVFIVEN